MPKLITPYGKSNTYTGHYLSTRWHRCTQLNRSLLRSCKIGRQPCWWTLKILSATLILQCNASPCLVVIKVHASPGFHLFQWVKFRMAPLTAWQPASLGTTVSWPCSRDRICRSRLEMRTPHPLRVAATLRHTSTQAPWLRVKENEKEKLRRQWNQSLHQLKEKETHWPEEPWVSSIREKEELVRIWRVTSHPLLQTKTLRATGSFKSASSSCQFVCIEHSLSM